MASIARDPGGRKRILCNRPDGKRVCIRLGKTTMRHAEAVKVKLEAIISAGISGHTLDDETARWVSRLDDTLAKKLARVDLIPKRASETLEAFIDSYVQKRTDVKPNTRRAWRQAREHLADYFGRGKPLRDVSKADAIDWRLSLVGKNLAEASVRKYCGFAKHFFNEAVEREMIQKNPFAKIVRRARYVGNPAVDLTAQTETATARAG